MQKMIKCRNCSTLNLESSLFCDECGASLGGVLAEGMEEKAENAIQSLKEEAKISGATSIGVSDIAATRIEEHLEVFSPAAKSADGVHARLVIERGASVGTSFSLTADESNLGRWDADNGVFPDIDLDAYDPEAKVSRKHARIILQNGKYLIEDLGSTNGTFVNRGRRLLPGTKQPLNDGDEIIAGKTFLRFKIAD